MWNEFKKFALKGNVIDLAVGVIIGGAFGKIVNSFVNDLIMPLLSLITGKTEDFKNYFIALDGKTYETLDKAREAAAPTINYGLFISTAIDFLVIALSIFIIVRQLNRLTKKEIPAEPTTKTCPFCQSSISIKAVRCPNCTSNLEESKVNI